jgi:alkylation response protein AidB-like acyl-CoA dehydrogenase
VIDLVDALHDPAPPFHTGRGRSLAAVLDHTPVNGVNRRAVRQYGVASAGIQSVDLELSSDQELLRVTTERFIESTYPLSAVRALADSDDAGVDRDYLRRGADLGWFAMLVPEEHGGGSVSGAGLLDAVVLAEERGRYLQPGPFVPNNVVAYAIAAAGSEQQRAEVLPTLIAGEQCATWALADTAGDWGPGAGVGATSKDDGVVLSGAKGLVEDAGLVDWLLVSATEDGGVSQFLVGTDAPGVDVQRLEGFDLTRRLCEVRFDDVALPASARVGDPAQAGAAIDRQLEHAAALLTAESVGAMDHLFEITVDYAKSRTAFGRPIGSFQALKHLLADTSLLLETSKAAAAGSARLFQTGGKSAAESVSMAKAYVAESGVELAQNCWQVFGGIAYTWEHDLHLYLRRLTGNASLYGDASWHRERVCTLYGL